jgi:hypothetical protein
VAVASAGILAGSVPQAWIFPTATADHSADEHLLETLQVFATDVVAGVGFNIYGVNTSQLPERPLWPQALNNFGAGLGTLLYGQWTIAWRY